MKNFERFLHFFASIGILLCMIGFTLVYSVVQLHRWNFPNPAMYARAYVNESMLFSAADLPQHGTGVVRDGGKEGVSVREVTQQGYFLFGPYATLAPGNYTIIIDGKTASSSPAPIEGAISTKKGTEVFHRFSIASQEFPKKLTVDLPFASDAEIQLKSNTVDEVVIYSIEIKRNNIDVVSLRKQIINDFTQSAQNFWEISMF